MVVTRHTRARCGQKFSRWDLPKVEQTLVAHVDGLVVQHLVWEHLKCGKIPHGPELTPFAQGRHTIRTAVDLRIRRRREPRRGWNEADGRPRK